MAVLKTIFLIAQQVPSHSRWILLLDSALVVKEFLDQVNIQFDCEFLLAESRGSQVVLTEVYRIHRDGPLLKAHYGSWESHGGLTVPKSSLYERRNNLRGLVVRATTIHVSISMGKTLQDHPQKRKVSAGKRQKIVQGYFFERMPGSVLALIVRSLQYCKIKLYTTNAD